MNTSAANLRVAVAGLCVAGLAGCAVVQPPPLPAGHPASVEAPEGARPSLPALSNDPTTRETNRRLAAATPPLPSSMVGMDPEAMPTMQHSTGTIYTCPMHGEIQQPTPGECPICGMKLVEKDAEQGHEAHR